MPKTTLTPTQTPTHLQIAKLAGPVKYVVQSIYHAHKGADGVIKGKMIMGYNINDQNSIKCFNKNGFRTDEWLFGKNGISHKVYTPQHELYTAEYDLTKQREVARTLTRTLRPDGKVIETKSIDTGGSWGHRTIKTYTDDGKELTGTTYHLRNGKEQLFERTEFVYDANGNMLTNTTYEANGNIKSQSISEYNEKNLRTMFKQMQKGMGVDGFIQHQTCKYNEQGDCIEYINYTHDGNIKDIRSYTYEYDSNGKRIVKPSAPYIPPPKPGDEPGETKTDAHGNWIHKLVLENNMPKYIYERTIVYHTDNVTTIPKHPMELQWEKGEEEELQDDTRKLTPLEDGEARYISDTPNGTPDIFNVVKYYAVVLKEVPSVTYYSGIIDAVQLLEHLQQKFGARILHSCKSVNTSGYEYLTRYTIDVEYRGYLVQALNISPRNADEFSNMDDVDDDYVYTSPITLVRPADNAEDRDTYFEQLFDTLIQEFTLKKKPEKPVINIIETKGNAFSLRDYPVNDNFIIKNLDINYGQGFAKFNDDLIKRIVTGTKGLILFHGQPGTGKTYYIRHLLRKMVSGKKAVIYMPPNMVEHLSEPVFMTFLSEQIQYFHENDQSCVLLIEDAEPLLARRQEGVRVQGITNLLNMTDGLLNDLLNVQIICTFNVDIKKLDSALLRPGRLIARKEFKALSLLDTNLLAQRLGIKHHFTKSATLGEIYSMLSNMQMLTHDVEHDKGSSTVVDDLL